MIFRIVFQKLLEKQPCGQKLNVACFLGCYWFFTLLIWVSSNLLPAHPLEIFLLSLRCKQSPSLSIPTKASDLTPLIKTIAF